MVRTPEPWIVSQCCAQCGEETYGASDISFLCTRCRGIELKLMFSGGKPVNNGGACCYCHGTGYENGKPCRVQGHKEIHDYP